MAHILKNDLLELHIDLPTQNYKHSRFDWTGKIVALSYKGNRLSGNEKPDIEGALFLGKGFYNEFGIDSALGYTEAKAGDWFHKIGVGALRKDDTEYNFHKRYEIRPLNFEVAFEINTVQISCQSPSLNGYSYFLKKEIELLETGFTIKYDLENRGERPIVTNEYNHNFLSLAGESIGTAYSLKFPFQIKPALFGETVNPEQLVQIGQSDITFLATPSEAFFFSNLSGGALVPAKWELEHTKLKIGISETGDFSTQSINLWGMGHVICPELFISINIAAGQSMQWSRTYQVYEMD